MKICILSMQRVDNMGSLLQAYALKNIVGNITNDTVEFLDIKRIEEDYNLLGEYTPDFGKELERAGFVGRLKKIDKYLLNRLHSRKKEKEQKEIFEEFRIKKLGIQNKSMSYDVCVIGSDEVFNCLNAGFWGFTSQLFGNVEEAKKVITYAASCGSTCIEDVPIQVKSKITESLGKVRDISVRDHNSFSFVASLVDKDVIENLDPVVVYDFENEIKSVNLPYDYSEYCIIYSYRNRIHKKDEIHSILEFCKKNNLRPIAVGAPQAWTKDYVVCDPFQCLKLFEKASFVITDTFHGAIFSFKYAKKYAIIVRESNKNKLSDLVNKLNISEHLMTSFDELSSKMKVEKDMEETKRIITEGRVNTDNYLKRNLF